MRPFIYYRALHSLFRMNINYKLSLFLLRMLKFSYMFVSTKEVKLKIRNYEFTRI